MDIKVRVWVDLVCDDTDYAPTPDDGMCDPKNDPKVKVPWELEATIKCETQNGRSESTAMLDFSRREP